LTRVCRNLCRLGALLAWTLAAAPRLPAQTPSLTQVLAGIEKRYNSARTLEVNFAETYTFRGRSRAETGVLFLRKPGKMRWQYVQPAGKLWVSDGGFIYSFVPADNRAEKLKFNEVEDLRAPLAFLIGDLHFQEHFRLFRSSPRDGGTFITAEPKSDRFPYTEVAFLAAPDFAILRLVVKGQDNSLLEFQFDGEKRNPPLREELFRFTAPPGVEFVDASR
jgi:outer membrane lipoprotein carrier protein